MRKLEQRLRENLKSSSLPKPIVNETRPEGGESCPKAAKTSKQVLPDETPALQFSDQGMVLDDVAKARAIGLVVGALVTCRTELRGIRAGACGIVTRVAAELTVRWQPAAWPASPSRLSSRSTPSPRQTTQLRGRHRAARRPRKLVAQKHLRCGASAWR